MSMKRAMQRLVETVDVPEDVRSELRSLVRRNTQPKVNAQQLEHLLVDNALIANAAIDTAKIKDLTVTTAKINDASITTAKIENLAVTDAKIKTLTAGKITAGTITGQKIIIDTDAGGAGEIESSNYSAGSAGWQIDGAGNAEFNNITARGIIDNPALRIESDRVLIYDGDGNAVGRIVSPTLDEMRIQNIAGGSVNAQIEFLDAAWLALRSPSDSTHMLLRDTFIDVTGDFSNDGYLSSGSSSTAGRPDASTLPAGARWYDTDDGQPIWSDGTDWRYADGTLA